MEAKMTDSGCICEGNWREIIKGSEPLLGKRFCDEDGYSYTLIGVIHGDDDYYYGMVGDDGVLTQLSCVGSLETHGFAPLA